MPARRTFLKLLSSLPLLFKHLPASFAQESPDIALALTALALATSNESSEVSEAAFALSACLVITQWLWVTRQEYNPHFERQKL